jgi:hypothetical protein
MNIKLSFGKKVRNKMKIAIDFDDVIHDPHNVKKGYKMGQPVKDAISSIRKLKSDGHEITVFSLWADTEQKRQAMVNWLNYFQVPWDDLTNVKADADVYLDDKGLRFVNWTQALRDIRDWHA